MGKCNTLTFSALCSTHTFPFTLYRKTDSGLNMRPRNQVQTLTSSESVPNNHSERLINLDKLWFLKIQDKQIRFYAYTNISVPSCYLHLFIIQEAQVNESATSLWRHYLYMEILRLLKAYFDLVLVFHLWHLQPPCGRKNSLIFWVNIFIM